MAAQVYEGMWHDFEEFSQGCGGRTPNEAGKHALCCLESMPFDTRGSLWFDGVAQTHAALFIALVVQLGIICFNSTSKGWYPALGGIPIFLMWKRYRDIARRRYAKRNLHGLSRGRMPLQGAAAVDRGRAAEPEAESDPRIDALLEERQAARASKDFATADRIRDELASEGIEMERECRNENKKQHADSYLRNVAG